jgi:hypothetical protein
MKCGGKAFETLNALIPKKMVKSDVHQLISEM